MVQEYRAAGAPPQQPDEQPPAAGPHRFRWVFHGPPVSGPGGMVPFQVPEEFADDLGRHLESLSFWTRDELLARADADGRLRPADLPAPRVRQDPPLAGPVSWLNPGPWVPVSAPAPAAAVVEPPDLTSMSDEQAAAMKAEAEAVAEGLRRREVWKAKAAEADPGADTGEGEES